MALSLKSGMGSSSSLWGLFSLQPWTPHMTIGPPCSSLPRAITSLLVRPSLQSLGPTQGHRVPSRATGPPIQPLFQYIT